MVILWPRTLVVKGSLGCGILSKDNIDGSDGTIQRLDQAIELIDIVTKDYSIHAMDY